MNHRPRSLVHPCTLACLALCVLTACVGPTAAPLAGDPVKTLEPDNVLVVHVTGNAASQRLAEYYAKVHGTTRSLGVTLAMGGANGSARRFPFETWRRQVLAPIAARRAADPAIRCVLLSTGMPYAILARGAYLASRAHIWLRMTRGTPESRATVQRWLDRYRAEGRTADWPVAIINAERKLVDMRFARNALWASTGTVVLLDLILESPPATLFDRVRSHRRGMAGLYCMSLGCLSSETRTAGTWTEADVRALIDRGATVPGLAAGAVYVERGGDKRAGRGRAADALAAALKPLGVTVEAVRHYPVDRPALALLTGFPAVDYAHPTNGFRKPGWPRRPPAGAIWSNLTSVGGALHGQGQTTAQQMLQHGWTAAEGCVVEPYLIWSKFPSLDLARHMAAGHAVAEAYGRAILQPYQQLVLGDPLARWTR